MNARIRRRLGLAAMKWPKMQWKGRHLLVLAFGVAGALAFAESRSQWSPMHQWNRAVGDMSLVLVALAMAAGPAARLWAQARRLLPWRRELGIWGTVLAGVHTVIILAGWVQWDLVRLFGFQMHPTLAQYVMVQKGFGLGNIMGIAALVYGTVLAVSSNDFSQRFLGGSVWKFLQQSAYVLWALILLHTAYFLYLHFLDFHRPVPEPNWFQKPFIVLVLTVAGLQTAAFVKTWKSRRKYTAYGAA